MSNLKHIRIFCIGLAVIFLCCFLLSCNDSDGDSSSPASAKDINPELTWYRDADGDGYGDPSVSLIQSSQPEGYVDNADDCDDYDPQVYPGAPDLCGAKDYNCDGTVNICSPDQQSISGRIINLTDAMPYINDDAYLQLVFYPADGLMSFKNDTQGRRIYNSDLATVDIPSDGVFLFETSGLFSGDYVIAAQRLSPFDPDSEVAPILANENDQLLVFSVSTDDDTQLDINLGNVRLPLPKAPIAPKITMNTKTGPAPPLNVSASDGEFEDKIRVTWESSTGATSYEVYRADAFAGKKAKVGTTVTTTYDDRSDLPCNVDFYYWVKAVNTGGESDLFYSDLGFIRCPVILVEPADTSDSIKEDTDNETSPPAPPVESPVVLDTLGSVSASDGTFYDKIRITWSAVKNATFYDIYRSAGLCGSKTKIGSSNSTSYEDFDVIGQYYYWVKANNSSGTSEFSKPDTGYRYNLTRPWAPTGVNASDGTYLNRVLVTWNKAATASSYEIYRAAWSGAPKTLIGKTSGTQIFDTDLECSTCCVDTYVYWVKAVNAAGLSNFSDYDSGYVYSTLFDPANVRATDGQFNCVWVTWTTVNGAKKYDIYRSTSESGPKVKVGTVDHPCDRFRDSTTTCPTVYYYWVKALDAKGYTSCTFGKHDTGYCVAR